MSDEKKPIDRRAALKRIAGISVGVAAGALLAKDAMAAYYCYGCYTSKVLDYSSAGKCYYTQVSGCYTSECAYQSSGV